MWIGFGISLLVFVAIGVAASVRATESVDDYLLAGRGVPPWLAGLSAVATNNSGFMFVGMLGFAYAAGVTVVWFQLAWVLGDVLVWTLAYRKVRERSARLSVASLPRLLGTRDNGDSDRGLIMGAGLLTLAFLGIYAAAQLNAGSIALYALLGWPQWAGISLGAAIVVVYCFSGGIRASIWTDAAQSGVMLIAMVALVGAAWARVGAPEAMLLALQEIDPLLVDPWPSDLRFGVAPYLLAFVFGGLGALGQPHILVRIMSVSSADKIRSMRNVYFAWYLPFSVLTVLAGLYSRVLLPTLSADIAGLASVGELALPEMSRVLLPEMAIGVVLAGLFAATMSTADSQVLACSAAITQDVAPKYRESRKATKLATLGVCTLAWLVALAANESVFSLVLIAWAALGATLGPVLLVRLWGGRMNGALGLSMMATGLGTVVIWHVAGLDQHVYKLLPGALAALFVWTLGRHGVREELSQAVAARTDPQPAPRQA